MYNLFPVGMCCVRIDRIPGAGPRSQATETQHSSHQWSHIEVSTSGSKSSRDGKASGAQVDGVWHRKTAWHKSVMWYEVSTKSYRPL